MPKHFGSPGGPRPGRTHGARNKLQRKFLEDLQAEWEKSGADALRIMAKEEPSKFVQTVAALMPREVQLEAVGPLTEINDEELQAFVEHVRQERAKLIEATPEPVTINASDEETNRL
jgi:hypothetical protein